jgi:hypothetical protein
MFCKTCLCDENDGSNPLQLVVDKGVDHVIWTGLNVEIGVEY